jgi:hypothetical protein
VTSPVNSWAPTRLSAVEPGALEDEVVPLGNAGRPPRRGLAGGDGPIRFAEHLEQVAAHRVELLPVIMRWICISADGAALPARSAPGLQKRLDNSEHLLVLQAGTHPVH